MAPQEVGRGPPLSTGTCRGCVPHRGSHADLIPLLRGEEFSQETWLFSWSTAHEKELGARGGPSGDSGTLANSGIS